MALWLFKQEPGDYSFADLVRDGSTRWTGVRNALARKHLSAAVVGDRAFFYHTGKEKAVVGVMTISVGPHADPEDADSKSVVVEVTAQAALARPVRLDEIKADDLFADWELVRMPRLSVMPVSEERWRRIEELARSGGS